MNLFKRKIFNVIVILFIIFSFGIGYAQISNINLEIDGSAQLPNQEGIVISNIHYSSCNDMTTDNITINTYYQSMFTSHTELGNTPSSFITVEVTVQNLTNQQYVFDGMIYDSNFYSNTNIVPTLTNITENTTILSPNGTTGDEITFYLTFAYLDPNNITNQELNSTISFHFTPTVKINYSGLTNASSQTEEYIRRSSFTNSTPTTYNPSVDLGSYSGSFTITDSDNNTLTLGTDYTYSNGIITFLNNLTADEYTITAISSGSGLANYIESLVDGLTPDSQGVYTATAGNGCTNTFIYDGTTHNNLRYVGKTPCNYIKFNCDDSGNNCETWRIIGVMKDVGSESYVKILKDSLDYSGSQWNSTASNVWLTSTLYTTLNTTYYNGLNAKYGKNQIKSVNWPLGGSAANLNSPNFYTAEHTTMSSSAFHIGLFSPSDYGYATSGGTNRSGCMSALLSNGTNYAQQNCRNNNWLYITSYFQWTMIPRPTSANNNAFIISTSGLSTFATVTSNGSNYNYRPCVHLIHAASIEGGDGSSGDPYELTPISS